MSYYVNTIGCDFVVRRENYEKGYRLLCELNAREDLKAGGCYPPSAERPSGSASVAQSPNKWFGWMDWNYDETCSDLLEVLKQAGFDVCENERGIDWIGYDGYSGCEEEFLSALAPVVEAGSYVEWEGECHEDLYRFDFDGLKMSARSGRIVWGRDEEDAASSNDSQSRSLADLRDFIDEYADKRHNGELGSDYDERAAIEDLCKVLDVAVSDSESWVPELFSCLAMIAGG